MVRKEKIEILGKCPPIPKEFDNIEKAGFENVELYIKRKHLENFKETISAVKNTEINISSVHTPHCTIKENKYINKSIKLADDTDSYLVFHSNKIPTRRWIKWLKEKELGINYCIENNPGDSSYFIKNFIFKNNFDFGLDIAHIFMSEKDYVKVIDKMLSNYDEYVNLIHFCDSTIEEDGLPIKKGVMDIKSIADIISKKFSGKLVLEVMPKHQREALKFIKDSLLL